MCCCEELFFLLPLITKPINQWNQWQPLWSKRENFWKFCKEVRPIKAHHHHWIVGVDRSANAQTINLIFEKWCVKRPTTIKTQQTRTPVYAINERLKRRSGKVLEIELWKKTWNELVLKFLGEMSNLMLLVED